MSKSIPPACRRARERLGLRVEGELEAANARELELHLASCASCREVESWMGRVDRLAASEPDPGVSVAHLAELEARILHGLPRATRRPWWRRFAIPTLAPSAALVLFVFLLVRETGPRTAEELPRLDRQRVEEVARESKELLPPRSGEPTQDLIANAPAEPPLSQQSIPESPSRRLAPAPVLAKARENAEGEGLLDLMPSPTSSLDAAEGLVLAETDETRTEEAPLPRLLTALRDYRQQPTPEHEATLLSELRDGEADFARDQDAGATPATEEAGRAMTAKSLAAPTEATHDLLRQALESWLASPARSTADSTAMREARELLDALE